MQTQKQWLDMDTEERVNYLAPMILQHIRIALSDETDKRRLAFGNALAINWHEVDLMSLIPTDKGEPAIRIMTKALLGIPLPAIVKFDDIHAIELLPEPTPQVKKVKHASFCCPNCGHPLIVGKGQ